MWPCESIFLRCTSFYLNLHANETSTENWNIHYYRKPWLMIGLIAKFPSAFFPNSSTISCIESDLSPNSLIFFYWRNFPLFWYSIQLIRSPLSIWLLLNSYLMIITVITLIAPQSCTNTIQNSTLSAVIVSIFNDHLRVFCASGLTIDIFNSYQDSSPLWYRVERKHTMLAFFPRTFHDRKIT